MRLMLRVCLVLLCVLNVMLLRTAQASHSHSTRAQQSLEELIGGSGRIEVMSVQGRAAPAVSDPGRGRIYFDASTNTFQVSENASAYETLILGTAPTFLTSILSPLLIGGTAATSALALRSTSGVGAAGADIIFQVGNNGATEAMRILNNGVVSVVSGDMRLQGANPLYSWWIDAGTRTAYSQWHAALDTWLFDSLTGLSFYPLHTFRAQFSTAGNFLWGGTGTATGTGAVNVHALGSSTAPSTSPADVVQLRGADIAGAGTFGLHIRDEGGNIFTIGNGAIASPGTVQTACSTVAALPAGVAGDRKCVNNQLTACPVLDGTFTGGGTVTCSAFHNGTAWVHS